MSLSICAAPTYLFFLTKRSGGETRRIGCTPVDVSLPFDDFLLFPCILNMIESLC